MDIVFTTPQETSLSAYEIEADRVLGPAWTNIENMDGDKFTLHMKYDVPPERQHMAAMSMSASQPYRLGNYIGSPGYYTWPQQDGSYVSVPFQFEKTPKRYMLADVDGDDDVDVYLEYQDGTSAISYNISADIMLLAEGKLTKEIQLWLQDYVPNLDTCYGEETDLMYAIGVAHLVAFQSYDSYREVLEAVPDTESMKIDLLLDRLDTKNLEAREELQTVFDENTPSYMSRMTADWGTELGFGECEDTWQDYVLPFFNRQQSIPAYYSAFTHKLIEHADDIGYGIGATLTLNDSAEGRKVNVSSTFYQSPAREAGLQAGDEILSVNGVKIEDILTEEYVRENADKYFDLFSEDGSLQEELLAQTLVEQPLQFVVLAILGSYKSEVTLVIKRGEEELTVTVPRTKNILPHQLP